MKTDSALRELLSAIDGRGYKAYRQIEGRYQFADYELVIAHVQGDPYAAASRIHVRVPRSASGFLPDTTSSRSRRVALCDFLTRKFYDSCRKLSRGSRGIGKGGLITIDRPVQEVLERNSMTINDRYVEARFFMGLPAFGRKIAGSDARVMFFEELPRIVQSSLFMEPVDPGELYRHIFAAEDADALRDRLESLRLTAFVADGALLPRSSGIDPGPMNKEEVILFKSPDRFRVAVDLPHSGTVAGMGIPEGVTLIVGGGYHGKSTLLNALELGVYNHLPGDGRERVVTVAGAVKIRAADGRRIEKTDISAFIGNLPFGKSTDAFSTDNASGSTSQAANICEALEMGARVLLLDEDTSATNFMIRDHRMQMLVTREKEPITPFIDRVRQLYEQKGVSTVLVMGGCGDYFGVADHVIQMTDYLPADVTRAAKDIARDCVTGRMEEGGPNFGPVTERMPDSESVNPFRNDARIKISAAGCRHILFGCQKIDLWDMEQIVDEAQTRAIAHAMCYATRYMDGKNSLKAVVDRVVRDLDQNGLDILTPYITGDLARFRSFELAGAINRLRSLKMEQLVAD